MLAEVFDCPLCKAAVKLKVLHADPLNQGDGERIDLSSWRIGLRLEFSQKNCEPYTISTGWRRERHTSRRQKLGRVGIGRPQRRRGIRPQSHTVTTEQVKSHVTQRGDFEHRFLVAVRR